MCLAAALLIAKCVGYLPAPNTNVQVSQACIHGFRPKVQRAARSCANEYNVHWQIK